MQIIEVFEKFFPEYMTLDRLDTTPIPESLASKCPVGGIRGCVPYAPLTTEHSPHCVVCSSLTHYTSLSPFVCATVTTLQKVFVDVTDVPDDVVSPKPRASGTAVAAK